MTSSVAEVKDVAAVEVVICESIVVPVVISDSERVSVDTVVVCESVVCVISIGVSVVVEVTTSERRIFITGTSSAVLINLSSMDAGKPCAHMRFAFLTRRLTSFSLERRYMVSSPAVTVSHTNAIRRSIMFFKVGYCLIRTLHWRETLDSVSRWSSKDRKCCFPLSFPFGANAGRTRSKISIGVARKRSALFVTYPSPRSVFASLPESSVVLSGVINQLLHSFFGAAMRVNS